ncbi:MAG TPA: hypothetical protein VFG69_02230 [Nannocystaceae bacterium]|nr:hypothetical protein [Nannocystaceae bacterium]
MSHRASLALSSMLLLVIGCAETPTGLAPTPDGDGPLVVFDFEHRPLPDIPFPNDIATRPDSTSPTGLRINASMVAPTDLEATARRRIDELSGWGVYQPINVRFDAPLDLDVIYERHRDHRHGATDNDFSNDAVYLIDVTPGSPTYLQPVPLDFGEGNFPVLLRTPSQYWEHDPKTISGALALETYDEDWDGDGVLDPGEDVDLDGVLDKPNVYALEDGDPALDPTKDLISFYEMETNTLIARPILPLLEKTTYAVVLTDRLLGANGEPVRSPFDYVNHAAQSDDVRPALTALAGFGIEAENIAFAWSFTTQAATDDLVNLRDGLYGEGPLSWIAEDFPPRMIKLFQMVDSPDAEGNAVENPYILPAEKLAPVLGPLASAAFSGFGINDVDQLVVTHSFYAYHVSGKFTAPRLLDLVDEGTLDARAWPADLLDPSLRDRIGSHDVQFWCAIPKREFKKDPDAPAPVVLYAHGYTSNKLEQLGLALHAKFGIAGCSIDAVLHAVSVPAETQTAARALLAGNGLLAAYDALVEGRAEDIDGDGTVDVGAQFFTAYLFRTRDNLRQTLLDWLTLVRLIRVFGTKGMGDLNGDGQPELLGDFDADGLIDIGGKDAVFFASGTSLGGLVSSMLSAIEPGVIAAAPISGGAGLVDLSVRSEQGGVVEALTLRLFGPTFVGEPTNDGRMRFYQLVVAGNKVERRDFAVREGVSAGDTVMVTNLRSGEARCGRVMPYEPPPGYENLVGWGEATNCSANDTGICRTCSEEDRGRYACDLAATFRFGLPSDVDDPVRVQVFAGGEAVTVEGDDRDCTAVAGAQEVIDPIETVEIPYNYRGRTYLVGDELTTLEDGYGFQRATPVLRRFTSIAQMVVEPADPAVYAVHYSKQPLTFQEDGKSFVKSPTNVMNVTTIGDPNVPVNTGVAIAKVAGFIELFTADERYGKSRNRVIIDEGVQGGVPWVQSRGEAWGPVLVDIDNLSQSTNTTPMDPSGSNDDLVAPRLVPPLRIVVPTVGTEGEEAGVSGIIFPMEDEFNGVHGFPPPGLTALPFDIGQYMEHFIGWYFYTGGKEVRYEPCMQDLDDCEWIPTPPTCVAEPNTQGCN